MTIADKKELTTLALEVHEKLRMMKVGDTTVMPLGKRAEEDVRMYVWAYAMHKNKWFETTHNPTANTIHIERVETPSFEGDEDFTGEEEE